MTSNLDLIAQLRAPCGDSVTLLTAEGSPDKYDPLRIEAADEIEKWKDTAKLAAQDALRLRAALVAIRDGQIIQGMSPALFAEKVLRGAPAPESRDG